LDIDGGYKPLLILPAVLCLGVAWQSARGFGAPRFPGSIRLLWLTAALGLPIPAYFIGGVAFWAFGIVFEQISLSPLFGGALGFAIAPPLFCILALRGLAKLFTAQPEDNAC
jgi:hypothetical protein